MKNLILSLLAVCAFFISFAQNPPKTDVILKMNGEEMSGKVQEIMDDAVKFIYQGETLLYTVKKSDIVKITYASGRIEVYNTPVAPEKNDSVAVQKSIQAHHNKIAVLPFNYVINKQNASEDMTYKVQDVAFNLLNNHAGYFEILPNQTVNAVLLKAGITAANLRSYSIPELCNLLGVEYIVMGNVMQDLTSVSAYNSTSSTYSGRNGSNRNYRGSGFSTSSSTAEENYSTEVSLMVYTDKGEVLFTQNRQSIWNSTNAYEAALQYLLKRTPIYQK